MKKSLKNSARVIIFALIFSICVCLNPNVGATQLGSYASLSDAFSQLETSVSGDTTLYSVKSLKDFIILQQYAAQNSTQGINFQVVIGIGGLEINTQDYITVGGTDYTFTGIGTQQHPFAGNITGTYANVYLTLPQGYALFDYLSSAASVFSGGMRIQDGILANHLLADTSSMTLGAVIFSGNSGTFENAGRLFGDVTASGTAALTIPVGTTVCADTGTVTASGSAGSLIGKINAGVTVSLDFSTVTSYSTGFSVSAGGGYAGGLIGSVYGTANLNFGQGFELSLAGNVSGSGSGGLVGYIASAAVVNCTNALTIPSCAYTVSGSAGAGGIAGVCEGTFSSQDITARVNVTATGEGAAGGIFGKLTENASSGAIIVSSSYVSADTAEGSAAGGVIGLCENAKLNSSSVSVTSVEISGGSCNGGYIGDFLLDNNAASGLETAADSTISIGTDTARVTLTPLSGTLASGGIFGRSRGTNDYMLSGVSVYVKYTALTSPTLKSGGAVGFIDGKSYVQADGTINIDVATGLDNVYSGAFAGYINDGCILDCNGAISANYTGSSGIAFTGYTGNGSVLRLSGSIASSSGSQKYNIVRAQNNSLIYSETGFTLTRGTTVALDDIGNYGQVIRNTGFIGLALNIDHYAVSIASPLSVSGSAVTVSNETDFAKLAITMSSQGYFGGVSGISNANYTSLLAYTVNLTGTVNLPGTGIESLTRADIITDVFSGTLNGANNAISLSIGEIYPDTDASVITTRGICSHTYVGLFSVIGNGVTVNDLTISGNIYGNTNNGELIYAGALSAYAKTKVTLTSVSVTTGIRAKKQGKDTVSYYGGLFSDYSGSDLTVSSCSVSSAIKLVRGTSAENKNTPYVGGFIANINTANTDATLDFSGSSWSGSISSTDTATVYDNAYVGGLVAFINSSVTTAKTTLGLETFSVNSGSVTLIVNGKSKESGGILGYQWYNVDAALGGTISGTLNITGGCNIGGLVNRVTGKMTLTSSAVVTGSYTGASQCADNSDGLVVCHGEQLFLTVKCPAASLSGATISNSATDRFDRLVGNNVTSFDVTGAVAQSGGIVSIETGGSTGAMPASEADAWYNLPKNPRTRYYYNVESLQSAAFATANEIAGSDELLLWHLKRYVGGTLKEYFSPELNSNSLTFKNDLDVSGLCLYPTTVAGAAIDLSGHTLTFGLPAGGSITDADSQCFAVQAGVFLDISNNLSFSNGILSGTVNTRNGGSGAVICGRISGIYSAQNPVIRTLTLSQLNVTGLAISGVTAQTSYAPLLVNKIRTCVTAQIDNITALSQTVCATSLLGEAGYYDDTSSSYAGYLNFTFSKMIMGGQSTSDQFSRASFLESLQHATGSGSCIYNFNLSEDWTDLSSHVKLVTYGKELGNTTQYYDSEFYVSANQYPDSTQHDFNTESYMRYVYTYTGGAIAVNLKVQGLTEGYGTCAHPYIIRSESQLLAMSGIIAGTAPQNEWKVNYPTVSGNEITGYSEYTYNESTSSFNNGLTMSKLTSWLQEAYYVVSNGIELGIGFFGIGTAENNFYGVINGNGNTITIQNLDTAKWGFINYANGCVIKNLNLNYGSVTVANAMGNLFGGVIGTVEGGDNIIDDVSVSTGTVTVGNKYAYAGGYVGLIVKGGVIFRSTIASGLTDGSFAQDSLYLFANPYIGRVLDGYAMSETAGELDNTDKNYSVWAAGDSSQLSVSGSAVTISGEYGMQLFSAAFNSGALDGSANSKTDGFVVIPAYGMCRANAYDNIAAADAPVFNDANAVPYPVYLFNALSALNIQSSALSINVTGDCDLSDYCNGFRGIGTTYSDDALPLVSSFNANGNVITINRNLLQYINDTAYVAKNAGLFNVLNTTAGSVASNFVIRGRVSLTSVNDKVVQTTNVYQHNSGGFAGLVTGDGTLTINSGVLGGETVNSTENQSLTVESNGRAGGFVGITTCNLTFENCKYDNIKCRGKSAIGGFIGLANRSNEFSLSDNTQRHFTKYTQPSLIVKATQPVTSSNGLFCYGASGVSNFFDGVGGLIGCTTGTVDVNNSGANENITVQNVVIEFENQMSTLSGNRTYFGLGGVIGRLGQACTANDVTVKNLYIMAFRIESISGIGPITGTYTSSPYVSYVRDTQSGINYVRDFTSPTDNGALASDFIKYLEKLAGYTGNTNDYYSGGCGGFVGSVGKTYNDADTPFTLKLTDVSVTADNGAVLIFSGNNCGGFVGDDRFSQASTFRNCSFNAAGIGNALIVAATRSSGIVSYMQHGLLDVSDITIGNSTSKTQLLAVLQNSSAIAAGVSSYVTKNGCLLSNITVQNTDLAGFCSAGVIGLANRNISFNTITVKDCNIFSKRNAAAQNVAGGVIAQQATSADNKASGSTNYANLYMNDITLERNNIITDHSKIYAGALAGQLNGASDYNRKVFLYANSLLWKDNLLGNASFSFPDIIKSDYPQITGSAGCGTWIGNANTYTSTVSMLGASRSYSDTFPAASQYDYNDIASLSSPGSTNVAIVYARYGAESVSDISTGLAADVTSGLAADPYSFKTELSVSGQIWCGEAMTGMAPVINELPWWHSPYPAVSGSLSGTDSVICSYNSIDTQSSLSIPFFHVDGNATNVTEYIDLLTNGGFSSWIAAGNDITVQSNKCTVTGGTITPGADQGSIAYNSTSKALEKTGSYDVITDGGSDNYFTVLTITFSNKRNSTATKNVYYKMNILLYFPQILEFQTRVIPIGYEDFAISDYITQWQDGSTITANTSSNGTFSLYVEYIFNSVYKEKDVNADKIIKNIGGASLPEGTVITMVDINDRDSTGAYGKAYHFTVGAGGRDEFSLSEFSGFSYLPLNNLKSLTYYDENLPDYIVGDSSKSADGENYAVERYLFVVDFPEDNIIQSQNENEAKILYGWYADTAALSGVIIENTDPKIQSGVNAGITANFAQVAIWNNPAVSITSISSQTVDIVQEVPVSVNVATTVTFPKGYTGAVSGNIRQYAHIIYSLTNDTGAALSFPEGTAITILPSTGYLTDDLVANAATANRTYTVSVDFTGVDTAAYQAFNDASEFYTLTVDYYLSTSQTNPRAGIKAPVPVTVRLNCGSSTPLILTVLSDSSKLGVNIYESEKCNIDFNIASDLGRAANPSSCSLKLTLYRKNSANGKYTDEGITAMSEGDITAGDSVITFTDGIAYCTPTLDENNKISLNFNFKPETGTGKPLSQMANYKLSAEVVDATGQRISNSDYFIFTVANIYTLID